MAAIDPELDLLARVWVPEHVRGRGDGEITRVSAAQQAMVHRDQLLAAGLTRSAIAHRVATGRLYPRYPGVYLVGRPMPEQWSAEAAAVLLCGGRAVLSHDSAAALWGLVDRPESVSVTLVGADMRSRPGLTIHRTGTLHRADLRHREGLPVTAPARTIIDVAESRDDRTLEQLVAQARVERLVRDSDFEAALARTPNRKGTRALRALLRGEAGPAFTRRDAEQRMLSLVRQAGLPTPEVNAPLLGFEVDFLWEHERLVVETDGWQFHGHRRAYESDRRRDQILLAAGYRVMRITWHQLRDEPLAVIARLAMALVPRAA